MDAVILFSPLNLLRTFLSQYIFATYKLPQHRKWRLLDSVKKRNTRSVSSKSRYTVCHWEQQETKRFVACSKGPSPPPDPHSRPKTPESVYSVHSQLLYTLGCSLHPQPEEAPKWGVLYVPCSNCGSILVIITLKTGT